MLAHVVTVEHHARVVAEPSAAIRLVVGSTAATRHRLPLRTWSSRLVAVGGGVDAGCGRRCGG